MSVDFHFLNVGDGDCTIVRFPPRTRGQQNIDERIMMLDLCTYADHESYEDVVAYYKAHFQTENGAVNPIFRLVCSHPHHDHICGLAAFLEDAGIPVHNFWDLEHSFVPSDFDGHPTHKEDWEAYKELGGPSSTATVLRVTRETNPGQFWNEEGDRITVLSPSSELIRKAHYKDDGTKRDAVEIDEMSYVLSIRINSRSVILAGDGRATPVWEDISENCADRLKSCSVLKAGHHGQECAFHEQSLEYMSPEIVVFSNTKEANDDHGAEKDYKRVCPNATVYKTWEGTTVVKVPFDSDQNIEVEQG